MGLSPTLGRCSTKKTPVFDTLTPKTKFLDFRNVAKLQNQSF